MKICANTMIFPEYDARFAVAKLAGMGFEAVDIFGDMPTLDYRCLDSGEVREIRDLAERYRVEFSMHGPCWDLNPASASRGHREDVVAHFREGNRLAAAIGAKTMVVHSGWLSSPHLARLEALKYAADTISRCLPEAEQTGVVLAVENTGFGERGIFRSVSDWIGLARSVGSSLAGLALDVGHAKLQGFDTEEAIVGAGRLLRHVRFHSNNGVADNHWRLDRGVADIGGAARAMKKIGFEGHASIDIHAADRKEEALLASRELLRALFGEEQPAKFPNSATQMKEAAP